MTPLNNGNFVVKIESRQTMLHTLHQKFEDA